MSNYSTITNNSLLRAIGPFRETLTDQAPGNIVMLGQSQTFSGNERHRYLPEKTQLEIPSPLHGTVQADLMDSAYAAMLASEPMLALNWDTPEDDAAWADL